MTTSTDAMRRAAIGTTATLVATLLAACGGSDDLLSQESAQGYASDSVTMPVAATSGADAAVSTIESTLSLAAAVGQDRRQPAAGQAVATAATGTMACPGGGTVAWTVTGGTAESQGNGQLDAGETVSATYNACATADTGIMLDGNLDLAVTERSASGFDLMLTATPLRVTTPRGLFSLTGNWRHQRHIAATTGGGTEATGQFSSNGLSLASTLGSRQAQYELRSLNWEIVRTRDANGALIERSHQGSLDLAASTPRRPNATLQISTQGALALGSDGWAGQGAFTVMTDRNTITCVYGDGTATLTLDHGNNGQIDRTWTLTRQAFDGEAG